MTKKEEVRQINIPELIVERYEPKEIVAFLATKIKAFNNQNGTEYASRELKMYTAILDALNRKMGGAQGTSIL